MVAGTEPTEIFADVEKVPMQQQELGAPVVPVVAVVAPTGVQAGTTNDYRKGCLGTTCCGIYGLLGTLFCCNTLRGRAGAATGCASLAGIKLIIVVLTLVCIAAGGHHMWHHHDHHHHAPPKVSRPAPVEGLKYSWEIGQEECVQAGGRFMIWSPLGPWCHGGCPTGYVHRTQALGRPEQQEYCVQQSAAAEPKPQPVEIGDNDWHHGMWHRHHGGEHGHNDAMVHHPTFTAGAKVRLTEDVSLPDGRTMSAGQRGRIVKVPGDRPGSAAQVEVGGAVFDIDEHQGYSCAGHHHHHHRHHDGFDHDDVDDARDRANGIRDGDDVDDARDRARGIKDGDDVDDARDAARIRVVRDGDDEDDRFDRAMGWAAEDDVDDEDDAEDDHQRRRRLRKKVPVLAVSAVLLVALMALSLVLRRRWLARANAHDSATQWVPVNFEAPVQETSPDAGEL
eukprot:TRINITY_DN1768_c0_g1_i1.p2 TRINITY_DN1768_c0_g1~~TRINITY_DN1768_c0_g1_i1.p2  ORF type:complete len:485 (+),score=139.50 TRINITY_DN1768_c0_g1_i1:106-1455(+)